MSVLARAFGHLTTDLRAAANPDRAPQMGAYMKVVVGHRRRPGGTPDAVRDFVSTHHDSLSGLTKREALKHL